MDAVFLYSKLSAGDLKLVFELFDQQHMPENKDIVCTAVFFRKYFSFHLLFLASGDLPKAYNNFIRKRHKLTKGNKLIQDQEKCSYFWFVFIISGE